MLSSLLTSGKQTKNAINELFEKKIEIVEKEEQPEKIEEEEQQQDEQKNNENDSERQQRTLFVGNVHINAKKNDIRKLFVQYGEIEKVWFRSIPVDRSTKKEKIQLPVRAAVLMGKMHEGAQSQNCYILFKEAKSAKLATQQDNQLFMNLHLRCSLEGQKKQDHIRTAFIGNLPFTIEEEEVRVAFEQAFGPINYVRVIRDPQKRIGKGFGYVCFSEFLSLKKALQAETIQIQDRDVRIKKASEQTKSSAKQSFNNSKNANQRILKKQQKQQSKTGGKRQKRQNQGQNEKQNERVQIHKKIIKMKKKRCNPKEIKEQVQNIKDSRRRNQKDTNIFNQY